MEDDAKKDEPVFEQKEQAEWTMESFIKFLDSVNPEEVNPRDYLTNLRVHLFQFFSRHK